MRQNHHITYEPEWIVDINALQHKTLTAIQRTKPTPQRYAELTNFLHAVVYEWNRMRQQLDMETDNAV